LKKIFLIFLPFLLFSREITLEWLESKPRSIAKDYYIWRFLGQDITPKEAQRALEMTKRVTYKIFYRYAKKIKDPNISRIAQCLKMKPKKLVKQDAACIAAAITPYKMTKLSQNEKFTVFKKLRGYPVREEIKYLLPPHPERVLLKDPKEFLKIVNRVGSKFRKEHFNVSFNKQFAKQLSKYYGFKSYVKKVVFENLDRSAYSLMLLEPKYFDARSAFYLGLFAYKKNLLNIAQAFFKHSYKKSYYQSDKDRALFWLYKTGDKSALKKLLNSWDLNIYTLLAYEIANKKFTNYLYLFPPKKRCDINLSDPFEWYKVLRESKKKDLKKYSQKFECQNTQGAYALFLEKAFLYHLHPYVMPYEQYLLDEKLDNKALLYALARQESRFIPGSVSSSFALGAMQFMPFLAKDYAKRFKIKNFDLDMMFDEKTAVRFGRYHINYLYKRLKNPLFVAYAYNGGIGYTKRSVIPLFKSYSDPLLAMEFVTYDETRKYGKKVLANYYIYRKILGRPFSLLRFFKLKFPKD